MSTKAPKCPQYLVEVGVMDYIVNAALYSGKFGLISFRQTAQKYRRNLSAVDFIGDWGFWDYAEFVSIFQKANCESLMKFFERHQNP